MENVDRDEYDDWVDDESLDLDTTMRMFNGLEPACIVTAPPTYSVLDAPRTSAGKAITVFKKTIQGPQRQAANFT